VFVELRKKMAAITAGILTVTGFVTGMAWGCSGSYCTSNVSGCTATINSTQETCCISGNCKQCTRVYYDCSGSLKLGPATNCGSPLSSCS
jgi:hypothetical protein